MLHAPRLQALEGRWRGLHWLVGGIEPARRLKVRVLPVTWAELCRDLERAPEFDQSQLFRKVYEDEFGMPGGEPFGLLVMDHAVRHRRTPDAPTDDVGALALLSAVAAAAFAPVVLSAHPALLEVGQLRRVVDDAGRRRRRSRGADHARWRGLAGRPDTRFLAVTLPRLLARLALGATTRAAPTASATAEHAPDAASRAG